MQDRVVCTTCAGAKFTQQIGKRVPCWKCRGDGYLTYIKVSCNRCYGVGKIVIPGAEPLSCPTCEGTGTVREPGR